jgi:hypothetical protein
MKLHFLQLSQTARQYTVWVKKWRGKNYGEKLSLRTETAVTDVWGHANKNTVSYVRVSCRSDRHTLPATAVQAC